MQRPSGSPSTRDRRVDGPLPRQRIGLEGLRSAARAAPRAAPLLALPEAPSGWADPVGGSVSAAFPGSQTGRRGGAGCPLGGGGQFAPGRGGSVPQRGGAGLDRSRGPSPATAMLSLSPATRIFVALAPVDMRQGFNGLYAWVQTVLGQEPTSGHWFVFLNKRSAQDFDLRRIGAMGTEQAVGGWDLRPAVRGGPKSVSAPGGVDAAHSRDGGHLAAGVAPGLKIISLGTGLRRRHAVGWRP